MGKRKKNNNRMARIVSICAFVLFGVQISSAMAATWYVDTTGGGDGTSWASSYGDIATAVASASAGDEIWIQQGTYAPASTIYVDKELSIYGGFVGTESALSERDIATNETLIDGGAQASYDRIFQLASSTRLDGLTMANGSSSAAGALAISGNSPVISHCKFFNNTATATGSSEGYDGGGAVKIWSSTPLFINCIFADNTADYGGAVNLYSGAATFINCTFTENTAIKGGAIYNYGSSTQTIYNSILWGNDSVGDIASRWGAGWTESNNIYTGYGDPLMVDAENGNFHIQPGSPCIDAGTMSVALPALDMDGDIRSLDGDSNGSSVVDIGADEYDPSKDYYADMYVDGTSGSDANSGTSWAEAKQTIQAAVDAAVAGNEIWVRGGTYLLSSELSVDKLVFIYGGFVGTEIQRVSRNWQTNPTTIDGQDSVRCIDLTTDADGAILDGFTITNGNSTNAGGVLVSASNSTISNCIIDSNYSSGNGGGVYFTTNATIQKSQISNNEAVSYGGGVYNSFVSSTINDCLIEGNSASSGGGVFNDGGFAPVITHSVIKDNYASVNGGGICNDEKNDAVITNCEILLNTATGKGGGVYSGQDSGSNTTYAEVQLTNNVIANNWATWGGGLYTAERSSVKIINCTIAGNKAATSGAGLYVYYLYSYTSVMNSILYGNVLDAGGHSDIYFQPASVTGSADDNLRLLYNNFSMLNESWHNSGAPARTGNIGVYAGFANYDGPDGDPLAGGDSDYHLIDTSNMIDQGISSYSTYSLVAPSSDIEGISRPQGSAHDLGAYEVIISTYSLTMASNPVAGGTTVPVSGISQVLPATPQDISASPATGYNFVNWTSGGLAVLGDPNAAVTTVTLTGHATVTANFCFVQTWYEDSDGDGYGDPLSSPQASCLQPTGYVANNTDCNDLDADEHPGQTWYKDQDGDGYSDSTTDTSSCERPTGYYIDSELTALSGDCNDAASSVNPGETEIADDGIDQNCDGSDTITCIFDNDQDGFGTLAGTTVLAADGSCDASDGESDSSDDCNDSDSSVHPGATEIADDGIDQNCGGSDTITCYIDADQDGYGTVAGTTVLAGDGSCDTAESESTTNDDCNDSDANQHPGQVWYQDSDGDGYGSSSVTQTQCEQPIGYILDNTDCDDSSADEKPGQVWYQDSDGDGYGTPFVSQTQCEQPVGYVLDNSDCNDSNSDPNACEDDDNDGIATPIDGYMDSSSFVDETASFSNNFTDIPAGGVTSGSVVDRADLMLSIGDSEVDGVAISATGGTGEALVSLCDFDLKLTSGDSFVATCGSLTLDVVSGPLEVFLNATDYVAVPAGVTGQITETSKGTFTVENQSGSEPIVVYADGKEMEVAPGGEVVVKNSFPWNMFLPAIIKAGQH